MHFLNNNIPDKLIIIQKIEQKMRIVVLLILEAALSVSLRSMFEKIYVDFPTNIFKPGDIGATRFLTLYVQLEKVAFVDILLYRDQDFPALNTAFSLNNRISSIRYISMQGSYSFSVAYTGEPGNVKLTYLTPEKTKQFSKLVLSTQPNFGINEIQVKEKCSNAVAHITNPHLFNNLIIFFPSSFPITDILQGGLSIPSSSNISLNFNETGKYYIILDGPMPTSIDYLGTSQIQFYCYYEESNSGIAPQNNISTNNQTNDIKLIQSKPQFTILEIGLICGVSILGITSMALIIMKLTSRKGEVACQGDLQQECGKLNNLETISANPIYIKTNP